MKTNKLLILLISLILSCGLRDARALSTAFSYQGYLTSGGRGVNGLFEFQFAVFDAMTNQLAPSVTTNRVSVSNGLFRVTIDFHTNIFDGNARFLEVSVRTNSGAGAFFDAFFASPSFTKLLPRQGLTATPYATYALDAGSVSPNAVTATSIASGTVVRSLIGLRDNVSLVAGANVTITQNGNNIQISQPSAYVMRNTSTSSTLTALFLEGTSAGIPVPSGATFAYDALIVGRNTTGASAAYHITGAVKNVGGAYSSVGSTKVVLGENTSTWDANAVSSDIFPGLNIHVTGDSTTIRWVATVRTAEVTNP